MEHKNHINRRAANKPSGTAAQKQHVLPYALQLADLEGAQDVDRSNLYRNMENAFTQAFKFQPQRTPPCTT